MSRCGTVGGARCAPPCECAHLREKYGDGGYLKLWISDSDNVAKLEELRKIIRDERLLHNKFEELMPKHKKCKPLA